MIQRVIIKIMITIIIMIIIIILIIIKFGFRYLIIIKKIYLIDFFK